MNTRRAVASDVPWLLNELRAFDEFSGTSLVPAVVEEAEAATLRLIDNTFFRIAEDVDRKPVGFLCAVLTPHIFNIDLVVFSELLWWVDPAHRGGRAGALLYNEFMDFGQAHANIIIMTLETDSPVNPATLEKRGFRLKERNYWLEVST